MKRYAIIFGKDGANWPDRFEKTSRFEEEYTAGKFETDSEYLFWKMFLNTRLLPCSMWYWIFFNSEQLVSGAIDPDDIELMAESIEIPKWVMKELERLDESFDSEKYGKLLTIDP